MATTKRQVSISKSKNGTYVIKPPPKPKPDVIEHPEVDQQEYPPYTDTDNKLHVGALGNPDLYEIARRLNALRGVHLTKRQTKMYQRIVKLFNQHVKGEKAIPFRKADILKIKNDWNSEIEEKRIQKEEAKEARKNPPNLPITDEIPKGYSWPETTIEGPPRPKFHDTKDPIVTELLKYYETRISKFKEKFKSTRPNKAKHKEKIQRLNAERIMEDVAGMPRKEPAQTRLLAEDALSESIVDLLTKPDLLDTIRGMAKKRLVDKETGKERSIEEATTLAIQTLFDKYTKETEASLYKRDTKGSPLSLDYGWSTNDKGISQDNYSEDSSPIIKPVNDEKIPHNHNLGVEATLANMAYAVDTFNNGLSKENRKELIGYLLKNGPSVLPKVVEHYSGGTRKWITKDLIENWLDRVIRTWLAANHFQPPKDAWWYRKWTANWPQAIKPNTDTPPKKGSRRITPDKLTEEQIKQMLRYMHKWYHFIMLNKQEAEQKEKEEKEKPAKGRDMYAEFEQLLKAYPSLREKGLSFELKPSFKEPSPDEQ